MENSRFKFRAWDTYLNKMVYKFTLGSVTDIGHELWTCPTTLMNEGELTQRWVNNDCLEFMQFTGLFDKRGKEIYEGDIVIEKSYPFFGNAPEIESSDKKCDELNYVGVVVWDDGYYLDLQAVSSRVRGAAVGQNLYDYENLEIIGNIYEHSHELLKEAK